MNGAERIAAERQRQIDGKGYDAAHDDEHVGAEINLAAAQYLDIAFWTTIAPKDPGAWDERACWPWEDSEFKPSRDPVRLLEKAGALIAAEIDRLLRLRRPLRAPEPSGGER